MPRSTSIVTVSMNRHDHLLATIGRVSAWRHHGEHLVVDWSSEEPLRRESLGDDPRIRLLRVDGEGRWNLCRAYNFALSQARADCLFKLDADCWPDQQLPHPDQLAAEAGRVCHFGSGPNGRLGQWLLDRELLNEVGGFNELLEGYGFDDKDLKARLAAAIGQAPSLLPEEAISVIHHSVAYRTGRAQRHDFRPGPLELAHSRAAKRATSLANRVAAAHCPWSGRAAASRYAETAGGPGHWRLVPDSRPQLPEPVRRELVRLRRSVFWGRLLLVPDEVVQRLPLALLPEEGQGDFELRFWHRLYWYLIRPLYGWPLVVLAWASQRRPQRG